MVRRQRIRGGSTSYDDRGPYRWWWWAMLMTPLGRFDAAWSWDLRAGPMPPRPPDGGYGFAAWTRQGLGMPVGEPGAGDLSLAPDTDGGLSVARGGELTVSR